jgi:hypothetical protein
MTGHNQAQPRDRPHGWIVQCPQCGADWKVTREQILKQQWQICPSCVDTQANELRGTQ